MADKLKDAVIHWKKKLDRVSDEDVILGVLRKLSKVPMTWSLLQETNMGKCIRNLSSRNDIVGEKALALITKWRGELTSDVDKKKNTSSKENVIKENDSKSSSRIDSRGEKKVKHHQKESLDKESKANTHHKKSSSPSKKYVTNSSPENNSTLYAYERNEASSKYISYDPHLDISEGYNPECPDLFPGSKSTKIDCDTYEPLVKRKLEVQTETVSESKSKKSKSVSKSDRNSEEKVKHKKHGAQESKSHSEKEQSLNLKKENSDKSSDNYSKKKSSDKSSSTKSTARETDKNKEKSSKKAKLKINSTVEFTSSEANFEDCLGLNDIVIKKKKSSKSMQNATKTDNKAQTKVTSEKTVSHKYSSSEKTVNKKHSSSEKTVSNKLSSSHSSHQANPKKSSSVPKEKLHLSVPKPEKITKMEEVDIMSTLPQTLPNYRPLPRVESSYTKKKEVLSNEDAILFMSSKREKTAVYSGRRSYYYTEVPSLIEISTRVLMENIEYIDCLGNAPYFLLKPVLEKCTPQQLLFLENYNPYLLDDTDQLWEMHCKRDCKLLKLEENETYRELYLRAQDERERKLKSITANISASMSKYNPARQVKLAYVDSVAKPPRDVARKQAKNGTALPVSHPVKAGPPSKATPRPVAPFINSSSNSSPVPVPNHVIKTKPKVAPLMAKTLKSMKQCFRR